MHQAHFVYFLTTCESQLFLQETWFLQLENGVTSQGLGARCAHCYWSAITVRQIKEIFVHILGYVCIHIHKYFYV